MKKLLCLLFVCILFTGCSTSYKEGVYEGSAIDTYGGAENTATAKITIDSEGKITDVYLDTTYTHNGVETTKKTLKEEYGMKLGNSPYGQAEYEHADGQGSRWHDDRYYGYRYAGRRSRQRSCRRRRCFLDLPQGPCKRRKQSVLSPVWCRKAGFQHLDLSQGSCKPCQQQLLPPVRCRKASRSLGLQQRPRE